MRDDILPNNPANPVMGPFRPSGSQAPLGTFPPGREIPARQPNTTPDPKPIEPGTVGTGIPASFFRRAVAFVADIMIVESMAAILGAMAVMGMKLSGRQDVLLAASAEQTSVMFAAQAMPLLLLCYFFFFTAYGGRTPGKMLLGLKVETAEGKPLTWARALGRTFGYLVSIITWGLGFLLAAGPAKRALHDRLAGTRVVKQPSA